MFKRLIVNGYKRAVGKLGGGRVAKVTVACIAKDELLAKGATTVVADRSANAIGGAAASVGDNDGTILAEEQMRRGTDATEFPSFAPSFATIGGGNKIKL